MKNCPIFSMLAFSVLGICCEVRAGEPAPGSSIDALLLRSGCVVLPQLERTVDDPRMELAAVQDGNLEPLQQYLAHGGKVNARLSNGMSLLEVAVLYGGEDVVQYLISQGAEVRKRDAKGRSLGTLAALLGRTKVLNMLLNAYPEPANLEEMWISLMNHAMAVYMAPRRSSFDSGAYSQSFDSGCESNKKVLYPVPDGHQLGVLRTLLERGVDPDTLAEGNSALGVYASVGYFDAVKLLLSFHADVNAGSRFSPPLMRAADEGHSDIVCLLEQAGADVRAVDPAGKPVLLRYAESCSRALDEKGLRLLCAKSDANRFGEILMCAKRLDRVAVANAVMERCASDREARKAALGGLCRSDADYGLEDRDRVELALALIRQGVGAEALRMPLRDAVSLYKPALVRCLLEQGGDARTVDEEGRTLLMLAVQSDRQGDVSGTAELLIQCGGDTAARDVAGRTAAMMAEEKGRLFLAELIRKFEAEKANEAALP